MMDAGPQVFGGVARKRLLGVKADWEGLTAYNNCSKPTQKPLKEIAPLRQWHASDPN